MKITGPGESSLLLVNVIKILARYRIPYAVVGAFAVSFYGMVRASIDADALISTGRNDEKLTRFLSLLKKDGSKVEFHRGDSSDPVRGVINIEDKFQNRVDLLLGIRGMTDDVYDRVISTSFMKRTIKIIGVEDLIAMKVYAGSAKDIQDVIGIVQVSARRINRRLLKQLTGQYGKKELAKLGKILK